MTAGNASTQYVCADNFTKLVSIVNEPAGKNCANGGTAISVGPDANNDGALGPAEVASTNYVCNEANGSKGTDGLNTLMSIVSQPAGSICAAGGLNVISGLDSNGNKALDPGEVTSTNYVCDGTSSTNGLTLLIGMKAESVGAHCAHGGQRITSGLDANNNGTLETGEFASTQYVCNGANGTNGLTTLMSIVTEPAGGNCAGGGLEIAAGLDANNNGTLDTSEAASTNYVCNGAPGPAGPGIPWVDVTTTSVQAVSNTGYVADSASRVTITLPLAPAVGDIVRIKGVGTGGWKIAQNAYQTIDTTNITEAVGAVWSPRDSARRWHVVASSSDGTKLVAAVDGGQIYTSTDSGVTWTARDSVRDWIGVASSADGTKLVATVLGGQIYTSADSGVTWTPRDEPRGWYGVASSADGTRLVATVVNGQIYTSTDSGVTWIPRESARNWYVVASSADGTRLAATVYDGQIYTSTDSGVTWTPRDEPRGWYGVASSADGTKLVATVYGGGQIYASTDSGATWTPRGSFKDWWWAVASSADGTRLVASVLGGQIYTSADSGVTWTARDSARGWRGVASSADGTKLVAAEDYYGHIYTSSPNTTEGTTGSISGGQNDAIELQSTGNNTLTVLSHEGDLVVQ